MPKLSAIPIRCACGADWTRCAPGQAPDALPYPNDGLQQVLAFPQKEVPARAWCLACDPMVRTAT